ncbi:uncharacterized protein N7477_003897 [Penicillium maclennaniae]|uniref:uncharacterized protein n=1 Tax=Penicillium maclennaniae TaxID=1343394 RepID=UPI0025421D08|nr:uncharacterized protein N7477_003897 [Penicillium maclennaniae]KAJ5678264.1 hypothetical protein N7477_003897 [Penicillium maclennaniae]
MFKAQEHGLGVLPEATEKAREIARQGQVAFVEIERMLDKLQNNDSDDDFKHTPMQERLKWCFRRQYVTYLLAQLESLKLSLIVMLQVLQLGNLAKPGTTAPVSTTMNGGDEIAERKAEIQNVVIVRYWTVKRLNRLWDAASKRRGTPIAVTTQAASLTKLRTVTFGESDSDLGDIERSPKDMVLLSEKALNRLLLMWIPSFDPTKIHNAGRRVHPQPSVSSDTEDDAESLDFENFHSGGHYLEGTTMDWRKPHSQEARQEAAQRRRQYSEYQAHVESDPEIEVPRRKEVYPEKPRSTVSNDEVEQRSNDRQPPISIPMHHRAHSNSVPSQYPPTSNPSGRPAASYPANQPVPRAPAPPRLQTPPSPIPGPPQYKCSPPESYVNTIPRSILKKPNPTAIPNITCTLPGQLDNPWGRPQAYNSRQPHHSASAYQLSTSSPETSLRPSPPRSAQRSPSRHSRSSREEENRQETRERRKRNATRGLVGLGAIAGFMDALEAFSIL